MAFKMKGNPMQRNFGIGSPIKITDAEKQANLLRAVPNKEAYDKLSDIDKKGFTKAGIEAGLPTKKSPTKPSPGKFFSLGIWKDKQKITDPKTGKKHCAPNDKMCPGIDMWKMGLGGTLGATALYTPQYFGKGLRMKDLVKKAPGKK